jgi:hypothetical protein
MWIQKNYLVMLKFELKNNPTHQKRGVKVRYIQTFLILEFF